MSAVRPLGPLSPGTSPPASVAASGSRTAKMKSGTTKPSNPDALRSDSSAGLSHVWGPLSRLYEHMTASAPALRIARLNGASVDLLQRPLGGDHVRSRRS